MSSYHGKTLPRISDETMFEKFTAALWDARFPDGQTVLMGRRGQAQKGLDVLVTTRDGRTIGIQCKAVSRLTSKHLKDEVGRALGHAPPIDQFVLVTSAPHDAALVAEAQRLTELHQETDLFSVTIHGWSELMRLAEPYHQVVARFFPEFGLIDGAARERIFLEIGDDFSIAMTDIELSLFCSETASKLRKNAGASLRVIPASEKDLTRQIEKIDELEDPIVEQRMLRSNLEAVLAAITPKLRRLERAIAMLLTDQDVRSPWLIGHDWFNTAVVLRRLVVEVLQPPMSTSPGALSLKIRSRKRPELVTWIGLEGADRANFLSLNRTWVPSGFWGDAMDLGADIGIRHALPAGLAKIVQFSDIHQVPIQTLRDEGALSVFYWSTEAA